MKSNDRPDSDDEQHAQELWRNLVCDLTYRLCPEIDKIDEHDWRSMFADRGFVLNAFEYTNRLASSGYCFYGRMLDGRSVLEMHLTSTHPVDVVNFRFSTIYYVRRKLGEQHAGHYSIGLDYHIIDDITSYRVSVFYWHHK